MAKKGKKAGAGVATNGDALMGEPKAAARSAQPRVSGAVSRQSKGGTKGGQGRSGGQHGAEQRQSRRKATSAAAAAEAAPTAAERDPRLPPVGTVLVKRDRDGRARCECTVEETGVRYRSNLYRSLSGAATAAAADLGIKGRLNGYLFWGIIKATRPQKDPGEYLRKIAARYEEQVTALLRSDSAPDTRTQVRRELEAHAAHLTELLASCAG